MNNRKSHSRHPTRAKADTTSLATVRTPGPPHLIAIVASHCHHHLEPIVLHHITQHVRQQPLIVLVASTHVVLLVRLPLHLPLALYRAPQKGALVAARAPDTRGPSRGSIYEVAVGTGRESGVGFWVLGWGGAGTE